MRCLTVSVALTQTQILTPNKIDKIEDMDQMDLKFKLNLFL
jgi:hypothetical protein